MLQKVAAMVINIAADLGLMASKVRSLLLEKYFEIAATSAACLLLDDNINNNNNINSTTLRPNRTAEQIVQPKGDKNILGRSRTTLLLYIVVLNTQRFSALVLDIGDFCDKKAYIAYGSSCITITSAIVYFFNKSF